MKKEPAKNLVLLAFPPLTVTGLLWLTRLNEVTFLEVLASSVLLAFAWVSFFRWRSAKVLRVFPLLAFMYWVFYALALFWGNRVVPFHNRGQAVSEDMIEKAMILAVSGVACLFVGMSTGLGRRFVPKRVLDFRTDRKVSWRYIELLLLFSIAFAFFPQSGGAYILGSGGRQVIMILSSTIPLVVFALLFRKFLRGDAKLPEIVVVLLFVAGKVLSGIASGWVGAGASLMIVGAAVYLSERRKIPISAVVLLVSYILFFQAGKEAFRRAFWGREVRSSVTERVSFWSSEALRNWQMMLKDPTEETWREFADQNLRRISLLQQTGDVLEKTPGVVPYQYGRTYSYMLVTLIPRAVWPGKPSVNDANRFYQVAYGLTEPKRLESVSISVGALAESFINFGLLGVFFIMIPLGILLDFFEHTFLSEESGSLFNAVGFALIPNFVGIESQLAQYLAGIVQSVFLVILVLAPVLYVTRRYARNSPRYLARPGHSLPHAPTPTSGLFPSTRS